MYAVYIQYLYIYAVDIVASKVCLGVDLKANETHVTNNCIPIVYQK